MDDILRVKLEVNRAPRRDVELVQRHDVVARAEAAVGAGEAERPGPLARRDLDAHGGRVGVGIAPKAGLEVSERASGEDGVDAEEHRDRDAQGEDVVAPPVAVRVVRDAPRALPVEEQGDPEDDDDDREADPRRDGQVSEGAVDEVPIERGVTGWAVRHELAFLLGAPAEVNVAKMSAVWAAPRTRCSTAKSDGTASCGTSRRAAWPSSTSRARRPWAASRRRSSSRSSSRVTPRTRASCRCSSTKRASPPS